MSGRLRLAVHDTIILALATCAVWRKRTKDQATSQTHQEIRPEGPSIPGHNGATRVLPVAFGVLVDLGLQSAVPRAFSFRVEDTSLVDDFFFLRAVVISAVSTRPRSITPI